MSLHDAQKSIGGTLQAVTVDVSSGETLVPVTPDVSREFRRNPRTIKRWIADPAMAFPRPVRINGRFYVSRTALERFKERLIAAGIAGDVS
jgi:hypothetical protein